MLRCPWCKAKLESSDSGVKCPSCVYYYERGGWWTVSCDEAHAHSQKCLVEVRPPKEKKRVR
jgi:hypothetical protein